MGKDASRHDSESEVCEDVCKERGEGGIKHRTFFDTDGAQVPNCFIIYFRLFIMHQACV